MEPRRDGPIGLTALQAWIVVGMAVLPEDMSVAIDELESAIADMESRLESARAERDDAKARQVELEIENANLRRELSLAHDRQSASADILRTIASAPGDAGEVLQRITETTARLFGAPSASIRLAENGEWTDTYRFGESANLVLAAAPLETTPIGGSNLPGTVVAENRQINLPDLDNMDPAFAHWPGPPVARAAGTRTMCGTPLRRGGQAIGVLVVYRDRPLPFTDEELALQQSFADQAVIAIENARLFNETQEALERQTATADILQVIANSLSNVQPVFDTIAHSARRLCGGHTAIVTQIVGDMVHLRASASDSEVGAEELRARFPLPLSEGVHGQVALNGKIAFRYDTENEPDVSPTMKEMARARGYRSLLVVPMIREGVVIGTIGVSRREPGHFPDKFIELLRTFADQAVIAVENARLIRETQEALERQTATADVLKVIASSPSDVQPVFAAIASSAKRLLGGFTATVLHFRGDQLHLVAFTPTSEEADQGLQASFPQPVADFPIFALVREGATIQFPDTEAEDVPAMNRDLGRLRGFRSVLFVPLMNLGKAVGILSVTRTESGAFAEHHVQLLQTFADQAVIAIENTRLFNETKEALERQTATADVLKVIASSPADVQPVFDAIAASAKRLLAGFSATVFRFIDGTAHLKAFTPTTPQADEVLTSTFPRPIADFQPFRLTQSGEVAQIPDTEDPAYELQEIARARGYRSIIYAPLMNKGISIGFIGVTRVQPGSFADHHVQLLQTFADQAVIAIENTRLFNETQEALERQTATAEILRVIASSPSDTTPVFEAIASSAKRLLGGFSCAVWRFVEGKVHLAAFTPTTPAADAALRADFPQPVENFEAFRLAQHGEPFPIPDTEQIAHTPLRDIARIHGFRSIMFVPLMNGGVPVGLIAPTRAEPGAFAPHHVQLLQTFADQAVIAIENTRLFNETKEALERQTATAEILKVIASSPSDVQPVFEAIAHSANRLIGGFSAAVFRYIDGQIHLAAFTPTDAEGDAVLQSSFPAPLAEFPPYELTREGAPAELPDTETEPAARDIARARGYRSMLFAPLMNEGVAVGIITVTRVAPGPFGEQHTRLLQMFADQAVIAIRNVGLFNEVQQRTEDLSESLRQQTAVGDVLKTISRSTFDLQPVLDTLVNSAAHLCDADMAFIMRREGDEYRAGAAVGYTEAYIDFLTNHPLAVDRGTVTGRAALERRPVQILDVVADPEYTLHETYELAGQRTTVGVPLLRENEPIGVIVLARQRVEAFTQKQIDLVATFADQAVIAIENVRLFNEVRQRTEDLSEALQQQTATADVLKVISRSAFDLQTVLDALLSSACRLCEADIATIRYRDGGNFRLAATFGAKPEWVEQFAKHSPKAGRESIYGRTIVDGHTVHIPDVLADPELQRSEAQKLMGFRAALGVPLTREGEAFGVITLFRFAVGPFEERQIELVQTFADQAVIAIENVRLFDEVQARTRDLTEALTYQTGSANILSVIASSPTDVAPALRAIVESACELCEAYDAAVVLQDGDYLRFSAHHGPIPIDLEKWPINRRWTAGRAFIDRMPVHIHDLSDDANADFSDGREFALRMGHRTILSVPLLREGNSIGAIVLRRSEVHPFTEKQIVLLQTFADQAVIAIENVRLFNETREALERQTATSDILKVIASSPSDVQPVFDVIVERAVQLCGARIGRVYRYDGELIHLVGGHGLSVPGREGAQRPFPRPASDDTIVGRVMLSRRPNILADLNEDDSVPPLSREMITAIGARSQVTMPMLLKGEPIGAITLSWAEPRGYTDQQIALLQTFADQAVIAIENARLFNEVQQRTNDLSEALTYQTGSAKILSVIASSPTDVEPVLKAIVESACELCEAYDAILSLKDGEELQLSAHHGPIPMNRQRWPADRMSVSGRAVADRQPVHVKDVLAEEGNEFAIARDMSIADGCHTLLSAPLLREGEPIGAITLRRADVHPFTDKQIALLQTFADQAVIAIGNVRLFEEVQAKTRDLSEALEYQTATGDVLNVISRSPNNLQPVMDTIVETAQRLCNSEYALILQRQDDGFYRIVAHANASQELLDWVHDNPVSAGDGSAVGIVAVERKTLHLHDALADPRFTDHRRQKVSRARTMLAVPLMQEDQMIGVVFLARNEVRPFTDKQVELVTSFADQAVIAISNVSLFEEVQAKTRDLEESLQQQTATSEVLQVISSSPGDLAPVFERMLVNATRVCGAKFGSMLLAENGSMRPAAQYNVPAEFAAARGDRILTPHPKSALAKAILTKQVVHVADMRTTEAYLERSPASLELVELGGARTVAIVPMLRDDEVIGAITVYRNEVQLFSDKQIELLSNFAKQAVIAIENARLLKELRQRTDDLSQSLHELRTAQDRLVQTEKLASLGQLTAGIAHEIKNPLNFVNNFAALSAELTQELNEVLKPAGIGDKMRAEVNELTGLLKDNLEKVVQHGKRADSIVKNMLLHSREGGGEHRPSDINALIDESLNLAYHGARAERPDFNVTLERDFDPAAGQVDLFPQEITRVFLNLVSNGFYAVTKRRKEGGEPGFEPTLRASTKNLGESVEIRIRDNGTGIPPEVKEKMFNPFFTTKPAGEGTGLGLSMSHDIIVKQHGGTIDVDTSEGDFTEFRIVLPRTSNFADKSRG
jgi:GAF domain-containing protein